MDNRLKKTVTAAWLAKELSRDFSGPDLAIHSVRPLDRAQEGVLTFSNAGRQLDAGVACTVIGPTDMVQEGLCVIHSDNPRLDFARALEKLSLAVGFRQYTEAPKIHPSVKIGKNAAIGNGVEIGEGTTIYHNVVIGDGVKIGKHCLIKSCAVIGEEGYGFEVDASGRPVRILHLGSVVIEDHVEVGSLTTVCRGTLGVTTLKSGCKIDDHVHIAHNVLVEEDAMVIACAEVSGSAVIGRGAWIAPNASILEKRKIGAGAVIGLGAVVVRDIPAGVTVVGNPAKPLHPKQ